MRKVLILSLAALAFSGAAEARGHRSKGLGAVYKPHAAGPRHRRSTTAKIESLGPGGFEPVKPYKGLSDGGHGKRRRKSG